MKGSIMTKIADFLTIKNAAKFLGVTPNTLRNWEKNKKLPTSRHPLNRYRLNKKEDLEQLLANVKPV
jgi:excisionase family DNA binding protein